MTAETLSKENLQAVKFFQDKLEFEWGPFGLKANIEEGKPLQIIDLRTAEHYQKAHIPGALNVLYEDLKKYATKLDKETPTVVYCYDIVCKLATRAALLLAAEGVNVKELVGGFAEWESRGLSVAHGKDAEVEHQGSSCSSVKGGGCG